MGPVLALTPLTYLYGSDSQELQMLLEVTRLTHALLSEHVALDPFDDLLAEVRPCPWAYRESGACADHDPKNLPFVCGSPGPPYAL